MVIFEDIARVLEDSKLPANQLAKLFGRERKAIYSLKNGACFRLDYNMTKGLVALGYRVALVRISDGKIFSGEHAESPKGETACTK